MKSLRFEAVAMIESERKLGDKVVVHLVLSFRVNQMSWLAKVVPCLHKLEIGALGIYSEIGQRRRVGAELLQKLYLKQLPVRKRAEEAAVQDDGKFCARWWSLLDLNVEAKLVRQLEKI